MAIWLLNFDLLYYIIFKSIIKYTHLHGAFPLTLKTIYLIKSIVKLFSHHFEDNVTDSEIDRRDDKKMVF